MGGGGAMETNGDSPLPVPPADPSRLVLVTLDQMPDVVIFSSVAPTLQEAKQATSELADVLQAMYLSNDLDSTATSLVSAVSGNAIMAFELLCESHEVQNVVASLASDPKVFKAVQENQQVQEFMRSHPCTSMNEESAAESEPNGPFVDIVHSIKTRVVSMMSSTSSCFRSLFRGRGTSSKETAVSESDAVMESSFLGLAMMVIMVVCLKREQIENP